MLEVGNGNMNTVEYRSHLNIWGLKKVTNGSRIRLNKTQKSTIYCSLIATELKRRQEGLKKATNGSRIRLNKTQKSTIYCSLIATELKRRQEK
jgi:hypothetical protein